MDIRAIRPATRLALVVGLSFLSCILFVLVRLALTGRFAQGYLIWNLFLAAVPIPIAWIGSCLSASRKTRAGTVATALAAFTAWIIFYPNAPYIFTDFIHVVRRAGLGSVTATWLSEYDLLWYDIVMNAAFAFVGHYLGLISMYLMHGTMRSLFGRVAGWAMMVPAILLSGFGIHFGRFARINSWDVMVDPAGSMRVMVEAFTDPAAMLFSLTFSFFIAITYIIFHVVKRGDLGDLDS